jgi:hypothetical protein
VILRACSVAWNTARFDFEKSSRGQGISLLFKQDHVGDVEKIRSLDLSLLRAGVEHAAARLDNRAVVAVYGWVGLAGTIAGAIVGANRRQVDLDIPRL